VGYLYCIDNPRTDWRFRTEAEKGLNGRSLLYPRGKVLGGCSSINGMLYMRGQARDYEQWAEATGESEWGWQGALADFKRHEDHHRLRSEGAPKASGKQRASNEFHASGGEWRVDKQRLRWDVLDAFSRPLSRPDCLPPMTSTAATTKVSVILR
jgi:choline dehydrogenase